MPLDRIDGSRPYTGRTESGNRIQNTDSAQGFTLLRDEAAGVVYEPPERERPQTLTEVREEIAREERAQALANIHSRFDGPGVTVELSQDSAGATSEPRGVFRGILDRIRQFFYDLWNGGGETGAAQSAEAVGQVAAQDESIASTADIVQNSSGAREAGGPPKPGNAQKRGNTPEDIAAFMVDYGGKRLAKNSDLLTRYDRHGTIVSMDPTVSRHILHGERNIRKY